MLASTAQALFFIRYVTILRSGGFLGQIAVGAWLVWMMQEKKITLREMCDQFDVTPRTLRHYEYIELLQPEKIGRTRYYGHKEFARLKLILRGRRFGFPLEEVRQWLLLYDADPRNRTQTEAWIKMSGDQIAELEGRLVELTETIEELQKLHQASLDSLARSGD